MRYTGRMTATLITILIFVVWFTVSYQFLPMRLIYWYLGGVFLSSLLAWYLGFYYDKIKFLSVQDKLTSAYNRSYIYEIFPKLIAQMERKHSVFSITILDLDDLKTINDTEGHQKGDDLLIRLSHLIRSNIRQSDIFARWGGDEFIIVAPFTSSNQTKIMIENILHIQHTNKLHFSFGIAYFPIDASDLNGLIEKADKRLYQMKENKKVRENFKNHSDNFLFQHSKLGIAFNGIDGRYFKINDTLCDLFGYSHEELLHSNFQKLIHPDDLKDSADEFVHLLEGNTEQFTSEVRYIHKMGNIISTSRTVSMVRDETNEPLFSIVQIQDITERNKKKAEELRLEKSERYKRLLKYLPEPILIHREGIILYANIAAVKLVKAKNHAELIQKSIFDFLHSDNHEEATKIIQQVMQDNEASDFVQRSIYCVSGELIETEVSTIRIDSFNDKPVILSVFRDITERKKAEELFIQSEKLSVIGQLAAGVAHEIRNPLTSLMGFTKVLKSKSTDKETLYFDIMQQELERINLIVNEFMTLAKPNIHEFNNGSLVEVFQSVISILETQAIMTNVNIKKDYSDDVPIIYCDENQLKQVFLNIIKNAIEAMPDGGDVTITIREVKSGKLHIQIIDQGVGIPHTLIEKIGQPFFTTKQNGTGLGLTITQRIIEAHHGTFHISSNEKKGTTVDVYFPNYSQLTISDV
jgi:diguanylate cyclase (GGDEF)-like protein/PAS domain S-box-containing protein